MDFDKHFDEIDKILEKAHKRMRFWMPIVVLFNLAIVVAVLGFVGWVVVKLMSHFCVL